MREDGRVSRMHRPLVQRQVLCLGVIVVNLDDCVHDLEGVDRANLVGRHRFLSFSAAYYAAPVVAVVVHRCHRFD